jgi:RsiW-degrading membrane proteinase PrsW (M82 family)
MAPVRWCPRCGLVQPPANFCRRCGLPDPGAIPPGFLLRTRTSFFRATLFSGVTLIAGCMFACVLFFVIASTGLNLRAISLALAAAILPTIVYGALLLWLDRNEPESWEARGLTFFWGAVIAIFLALFLNTAAWSIFSLTSGPDTSEILTAVIAAPLVEESAKGVLVLLVLGFYRRHIDGVLDGMLFGALVGLGFAMTENISYFGIAYADGGATAVGLLFVIRSVINGLGHAVWTSFTGAAVGWARARHGRGVLRLLVPMVGWGAAVIGHGVWNLFASIAITVLSVGLERVFFLPEWQAFLIGGIVGGLPFSVPPLLIAVVIALLGRDQEQRVVRDYLPIEVSLGTITPEEYRDVIDPTARKRSLVRAREQGGSLRRAQQRRFNEIVTALAFFHFHAIKGERPHLPEIRRAEQLRWNLSALRWAMANPGATT